MDEIVFLFDVDNTLLDNDRVQEDLGAHLAACYGEAAKDRYWAIFEELRRELGYADFSARSSATGSRTCTIRASCECRAGWSTIRSPSGSIPAPLTP